MACDVNKNFAQTRFYVREHLTPANKLLLKQLKEVSVELKVKYVCARDGRGKE